MDYKTNVLSHEAVAEDNLLPEIEGLKFYNIGKGIILFDYTAFFENNKLQIIDYKIFMRTCKYFIESIVKSSELNTTELFYLNTYGHMLVRSNLVFLFLMFANSELMAYFNSLLGEVLSNGVTYSNGFAYSLATSRLPDEILQDIMNKRSEENGETANNGQ